MRIVDLYLESIQAADWNPNQLDGADLDRLRQSIQRFGLVAPLVVRSIGEDVYETIGGAQRLSVLRELGIEAVPCVIVEADDVEARLLSQCLNRIAGEDDLGLKAELLRKVLAELPQQEVLRVLPE